MKKDEFNIKFGEFIRERRESLGLKQSDVSAAMNLDQQSISRFEKGKISPSLHWCFGLADALGVPLPKLLEEFTKKKK